MANCVYDATPGIEICEGTPKPPLPLFRKIVPGFDPTSKSLEPSPLRSPTAIQLAEDGVLYKAGVSKVPSPFPNRTSTPLIPLLEAAIARSSLPSLLKSETTRLLVKPLTGVNMGDELNTPPPRPMKT